jgi:hypothetical protein
LVGRLVVEREKVTQKESDESLKWRAGKGPPGVRD